MKHLVDWISLRTLFQMTEKGPVATEQRLSSNAPNIIFVYNWIEFNLTVNIISYHLLSLIGDQKSTKFIRSIVDSETVR